MKNEELERRCNYYLQVIRTIRSKVFEEKIDSIVFSKDRAMQLHAFLESYLEMVTNRGALYVLYKTTSVRHRRSYDEIINQYCSKGVVFIEELDFREQLIDICKKSLSKTIGLFVDDMIFLQRIDYKDILNYDTLDYVVSLGRGSDLTYSIVLQKAIMLPSFTPSVNGFLLFKWDEVKEYSDWSYPLGVGGYFYGNAELNVMLENIGFKAPNSLENNLQYFKPFFIHRYGVCHNQVAAVNVAANLVQTESYNPVFNTFSIEELLRLWEEGNMIDLDKFYGVAGSIAQEQNYQFIKRMTW